MTTCAEFESAVADLAIDAVPEPQRAALLAHRDSCAACAALLADVVAISDAVVGLAPEAEPPAGFETRAVALMTDAPATVRAHGRRSAWAALAVCAVVLASVAGFVAGRTWTTDAVAAGRIVTAAGEPMGSAELSTSGTPRIVLTMATGEPWGGSWTCQLRDSAGRWIDVGRWTHDDVRNGVWATGVPSAVEGSREMRILGASGRVIARAELHES